MSTAPGPGSLEDEVIALFELVNNANKTELNAAFTARYLLGPFLGSTHLQLQLTRLHRIQASPLPSSSTSESHLVNLKPRFDITIATSLHLAWRSSWSGERRHRFANTCSWRIGT
jgi:hypothetical protein